MIEIRTPRRPRRTRLALGAAALVLAFAHHAHAQESKPEGAPAGDAKAADTKAADAKAEPKLIDDKPADVATLAKELEAQKEELAAQKKQLEEATQRLDDAEKAADSASKGEGKDEQKLRLYGFADVGIERAWARPTAPFANVGLPTSTSFVVGNLDVYFDAQPAKNWRSLFEIRFTNAPQGSIQSYGGLGGGYKQTQTKTWDTQAGFPLTPMWAGSVVIERAQIDYTALPFAKVRVGNFFTPFGIWNQDHGQPTLISTTLPAMLSYNGMPIRQTGIMVYGNHFVGDWELGYNATVTNGRQELSNFAMDDERGFGGRVYANNEKGEMMMKFGLSGYTGKIKDQTISIVSANPTVYNQSSTVDAREVIGGADVALDIGKTRVRAEGLVRKVDYENGYHGASDTNPTMQAPNAIWTSGYLQVAHQLNFLGLEPYLMMDAVHGPTGIGDTLLMPSAGLNIHVTNNVLIKGQVLRFFFVDSREEEGNYTSSTARNNTTYAVGRLVVVF